MLVRKFNTVSLNRARIPPTIVFDILCLIPRAMKDYTDKYMFSIIVSKNPLKVIILPKMCPFTFSTGTVGRVVGKGLPRDCQEDKYAWWTGSECAVLTIAENLRKK